MLRYLFGCVFCFFFISVNIATSFEIESYGDKDSNVILVKKRNTKVNSNNKNNKNNSKKKSKNPISNIGQVSVKEKVNGQIVKVNDIYASKQISASATGNIDSETANNLLNKSNNDKNIKTVTKEKDNIKKSASANKKNKNKVKSASLNNNKKVKEIVSYSGQTIAVDNNLCKFVDTNDVVNLKKTLSMMRYGYKYVNWRCKNNTSLLLLAIEKDNYLSAKLLIEKGADPNLQDEAGVTPLHWISRNESENSSKILSLLINNDNLNLNLKDIEGYTPLMRAVEFEKDDIVEALVKAGANVDIKNKYGKNAINIINSKIAYLNKNNDSEGNKNMLENDICSKILKILKNENR